MKIKAFHTYNETCIVPMTTATKHGICFVKLNSIMCRTLYHLIYKNSIIKAKPAYKYCPVITVKA
jgi:hypothetical protein